MPNNPGNKGHGGNELVILPRPVKSKGIHPLRVRIPETRKESGQFAVLEWAKRSTKVKKFKRITPIIKVNDPADVNTTNKCGSSVMPVAYF